jgi:hypothetical protein
MLTLKKMLEIWKKDCGAPLPVALDRLDNPDNRESNYYPSYIPTKPGGKTVRVELGYECGSDGNLRIVQR